MGADSDDIGRGSPFWRFSLAVYRSPEVQRACLALQDGAGVDVNMLLFSLWMGACGRELTAGEMRRAGDAVEAWRVGVVVPLRAARRALKEPPQALDAQGAMALRNAVKRAELEAERLQQQALFLLAEGGQMGQAGISSSAAAKANVAAYASVLGRTLPTEDVAVLLSATEAHGASQLRA
jgi:uncharacterized protein (TIGR02444 family)